MKVVSRQWLVAGFIFCVMLFALWPLARAQQPEKIQPPFHRKNRDLSAMLQVMAGIRGKSGPPGNQNALDMVWPGSHNAGLTALLQRMSSQFEKRFLPVWFKTKVVTRRSAPPCACLPR